MNGLVSELEVIVLFCSGRLTGGTMDDEMAYEQCVMRKEG